MTSTESVSALPARRPALVVAHPGHELRVFGWMEIARPVVFVLTDGSGSAGEARIESTTALLEQTSAVAGPIYGRMSDRQIYAAMLARDFDCFRQLADELADALIASGVDTVVGDSVEGYNPSHDVCRLVINTAVDIARRAGGLQIASYDFPLVEAPDQCPEDVKHRAWWVRLDDAALDRKLKAAREYSELAADVDRALERFGTAPFMTECLRPVKDSDPYGWDPTQVPFYETYGEKRVAAGAYDQAIRFRDHVMPLAQALWNHRESRA